MKKFLTLSTILVLACFTTNSLFAQATLQVGGGKTPAPFIIGNNEYSTFTQTIYTADLLPSSMVITAIAFEFVGVGEYALPKDFRIWMGNTTQTDVTGRWVTSQTGRTLVFSGDLDRTPPAAGEESVWRTFVLSTPFNYTGGNLVVTTSVCNYNVSAFPGHSFFRVSPSSTGNHTTAWWSGIVANPVNCQENTNGISLMHSSAYFLNARFTYNATGAAISITPNPLAFELLEPNQNATQTVAISNTGTGTLTITGANISNPAFTHNATFPITLNAGQSREVDFTFSPDKTGDFLATATFMVSGALTGKNTVSLRGRVPEFVPITVGTGTIRTNDLMASLGRRTYSQTIYTADLLPPVMNISEIAFEYAGVADIQDKQIKIWMSTTTESEIDGKYVDVEENRQLVYEGTFRRMTVQDGESIWLPIVLQTPYLYNGNNLVITMSVRGGGSSAERGTQFRATPSADNRVVMSGHVEPNTPDVFLEDIAAVTVTSRNFSNIRFTDKGVDGPVFVMNPVAVKFPEQLINTTQTQLITISNTGKQPLTISNILISDLEFSHNATFPIVLNPGASQDLNLIFTPEFQKEYFASATFVVDEALFYGNNILPISGRGRDFTPSGMNCFEPDAELRLTGSLAPVPNAKYAAGQYILPKDHIGTDHEGRIRRIGFQAANVYTTNNVVAIYLKKTNMTAWAFGGANQIFVNASEMTKVYEGPIIFRDTGWNYIDITPFIYDGTENLLVGIYTLESDAVSPYPNNTIRISRTSTNVMTPGALHATRNTAPIDPYSPFLFSPAPGNGITTSANNFVPNMCFVFDEIPNEANIFTSLKSLDYQEKEMNTVSTLPVKVTNMGYADLVITNVTFTSADFFLIEDFPITIPFGKDTILNFGITPQQLGLKTGRATFEFAAPTLGNPLIDLSVYGHRFNALMEGFEGDIFPPIGWRIIDANNDGHTWTRYVHTGVQGTWHFMRPPHEGRAMVSPNQSAGTPTGGAVFDDWLITPKMRYAAGDKFSFYAAGGNNPDWNRTYVYLSRTGNNIADFDQTIDFLRITSAFYDRIEYDLSEFLNAGDEFYIAFQERSYWTTRYTQLDMFRGSEVILPDNDLMVQNFEMANGMFKVDQPRTYTATVANAGINTIAGDDFTVELCYYNQSNQIVVAASKPGQTVERKGFYTVSFDYAFTVPGKHRTFIRVVYAQDEDLSNNVSNIAVSDILTATTEFVRSGTLEPDPGNQLMSMVPVFFLSAGWMGSVCQTYHPKSHFNGVAGVVDRFRYYIAHETARPNIHIKIYMANTTLDSLSTGKLLNGYEMELVHDGRITFPKANTPYEVFEIMLHTPFTYTGENLMMMIEYQGGQGTPMMHHFTSAVNREPRTFIKQIQPFDVNNINASGLGPWPLTPVTSFFIDQGQGMGNLLGSVVYDESGNPAAGARVAVTSATYPQMNAVVRTDATGNFNFSKIYAANDLKVTVSMLGFLDAVVENVNLAIGGTVTVPPIPLQPRPRVTVSGRVMTSDRQEPLQGATVKLFGMADFTTTTGANGVFTFNNVWNNSPYRLEIEHADYQKLTTNVQVENANPTSLGDFTVLQTAHRANAVRAAQLADQSAELNWFAPLDPFTKIFRRDDGTIVGNLTLTDPHPQAAVGPAFHENGIIQKVSWFQPFFSDVVVTDTIDIVIFGLHPNGTPNYQDILGRFRNIGTRPNQWNEYVLPTQVTATNGFMVGLAGVNRSTMVFIYDQGNHPDWRWQPRTMWAVFDFAGGDEPSAWAIEQLVTMPANLLIRAEGIWTGDFIPRSNAPALAGIIEETTKEKPRMLTMMMPELTEGYLTEMPEEPVKMLETVLRTDRLPATSSEWIAANQLIIDEINNQENERPASKSSAPLPPVGYNIYRADLSTNSTFVRINTAGPVTTTRFVDPEYASLARGRYQYAVTALYVGGIESARSLSNILDKDVFVSGSITITHNATGHGSNILGGAFLSMQHNTTGQRYEGALPAGTNGVITFADVYRGIYTVTINAAGFERYIDRTLDFTTAQTVYNLDVELTEEILDPYALRIKPEGSNVEIGAVANFSWNPAPFFDGAENHPNFTIDNVDGWIFYTPHNHEVSHWLNNQYPNRGVPQAFTIFNPSATTPPVNYPGYGWYPYQGQKFFKSWSSFGGGNATTTDSWMISDMDLGFENDFDFSFYVGGVRGYEEYQVLYSTGSVDTRHFRTIGGTRRTYGDYGLVTVKMPVEAKRVAIRHFYDENLGLRVDNITIGIPAQETKTFKHYEVYLDDRFVGQTTNVDFQFTELRNGIRTAGVVAVYSSGKSEMSTIEFEVTGGLDNKFYVDVLEMENGTIVVKNPAGDEIPSGTLIDGGTMITITAVPEYGYRPLLVTVDGTPFASGSSIAITKDLLVTATFEIRTYSITFDPNGGTGTMAPQGFTYGIPQNLTANAFTPPTDMYFIGWAYTATGDIVYSNQAEYFATENKTLFAIWDDNPVVVCTITLSANPSVGGTVSGGGNHNQGLQATVRATANTGYRFVNWTEGETTVSTEANYSFTVTDHRTLVANFVQLFRVNITTPTNGTISLKAGGVDVNHGDEFDHGTVLTLLATPAENYEFVRWTHDNHTGSTHSHTLTNHITISAVFRLVTSIRETEKEILTIYPNPVKDELNIQTEQVIRQIVVFDLSGKIMMNLQGNHRTINMQTIPIGNYIIRIHTENAIIPVRIVKQ